MFQQLSIQFCELNKGIKESSHNLNNSAIKEGWQTNKQNSDQLQKFHVQGPKWARIWSACSCFCRKWGCLFLVWGDFICVLWTMCGLPLKQPRWSQNLPFLEALCPIPLLLFISCTLCATSRKLHSSSHVKCLEIYRFVLPLGWNNLVL